MYTDGGPDHRVTFLSVQLALIALFLEHDLDFLCAARTAPCHSWSNPVERIMSTLNLGLQCVGLMREKMDDEFEKTAQRCKSLKDLRKKATESADFKSMAIVKSLLAMLFGRLELKEEMFTILNAASEEMIGEMMSVLNVIEPISSMESITKASLKGLPLLTKYVSLHCTE